MPVERSHWTSLPDRELLDQCDVDTYRASGPGGQKRNKTSSAVRLRHRPSGLLTIGEESRSQHENKARALKRLRQRLYLQLREPLREDDRLRTVARETQLKISSKNELFWPLAGLALDGLEAHEGRVSETAAVLGVSTGHVIDFLAREDKVWEQANHIRQRFGHKLLRRSD